MKIIYAFVLIMLLFVAKADFEEVKCSDYEPSTHYGGTKQAFSLDLCRSSNYDKTNYVKCCFIKWEDAQERRHYNCIRASREDFADIDAFEETINRNLGVEDAIDSIDCKSSYLYGSIFLILALLF